MEISKTEIGNALTSADENHILATANDIYDETQQSYQSEINQSLAEGKQDKLVSGTNIKTINGTSLLGEGNVSIESGDSTGDVDEGRLVWSDEDSLSTLMDIAYLNGNGNKIAGIPPTLVTIEYSADNGATWVDSGISDANKTRLTNHRINGDPYIRPNGSTTLDINYQTRITIDLIQEGTKAWVGCFEFRKIILKCNGIQKNDTHTMTIEMQKYGSTTWDIIKTSRFWGSPGFFSIPTPKRTVGYPSSRYYRKVRLTWQTGDVYTNVANINGVYFISDNTVEVGGKKPSQYAITGTPYSIDYDQNTIFPNAIKGKKLITDGGKSTQVVKGDGSLEEESALAVASAIDAEHAQEADYAGVADKADKLTNARTISLSGGATSTAVAFDGSKNINIPVKSLGDLSLTRTYKDDGSANALSLADLSSAKFASNRLAFNNPDGVLIYKSNDGGATWTDYGATNAQKINFISGITERIYIGGKTTGQVANQDRLRIILTRNRNAYTTIEEFLILLSTNGAKNCKVKLSYLKCSEYDVNVDYNAQAYTELTTKQVLGWSGWNRLLRPNNGHLGGSSPSNVEAFVLEFWFESYTNGYENNIGFAIYEIIGIGNTVFSNSTGCCMMNDGHLYAYDHNMNATFPANVTSKKINATDFLTALGGIATGTKTTAIGEGSNSEGYYTTAIGYKAKAIGMYTTAIGTVVEASTTYQTVIGKYNDTSNHAFVIGWGTAYAKKNIFSVDTSGNVYGTKFITQGGNANQVVLGDGSLKELSEISPITDADAEILLDNHIHNINVNANGNDVNINVIESSKNGNTWDTEEKNIPIPVATQDTAGIISAADKKKIDNINYDDNTLYVGDGNNGMLTIGYESSKASADMRVFRDRYATIHVTSYDNTSGGSIVVMESKGGKGTIEVNGDQLAKLVLSGAGQVCATLTKENEDGTDVKTIIDAEEGITAPKLATIGGTSEQILLGDGTLITFDELKAKLGLI